MSNGPIGDSVPLDVVREQLPELVDKKPSNVVPFERVSPLDKHAHVRRTVEEHHEALQVHQHVLQGYAQLHGAHAERTAQLKTVVDTRLDVLEKLMTRGFLGRLRWLFTGK